MIRIPVAAPALASGLATNVVTTSMFELSLDIFQRAERPLGSSVASKSSVAHGAGVRHLPGSAQQRKPCW